MNGTDLFCGLGTLGRLCNAHPGGRCPAPTRSLVLVVGSRVSLLILPAPLVLLLPCIYLSSHGLLPLPHIHLMSSHLTTLRDRTTSQKFPINSKNLPSIPLSLGLAPCARQSTVTLAWVHSLCSPPFLRNIMT